MAMDRTTILRRVIYDLKNSRWRALYIGTTCMVGYGRPISSTDVEQQVESIAYRSYVHGRVREIGGDIEITIPGAQHRLCRE